MLLLPDLTALLTCSRKRQNNGSWADLAKLSPPHSTRFPPGRCLPGCAANGDPRIQANQHNWYRRPIVKPLTYLVYLKMKLPPAAAAMLEELTFAIGPAFEKNRDREMGNSK